MAASACSTDTAAALRQSLESYHRDGRYLDTLRCVSDAGGSVEVMESGLSATAADEFRYAVARMTSDAIERLGHDSHHKLAANWWDLYLQNVSSPYDLTRVDFATRKMLQHGRHGVFVEHWPTVLTGLERVGRKITADTAKQLFSILYRCPYWTGKQVSSDVTVCQTECKPFFSDTVKKLKPAFNPAPGALGPGRDVYDRLLAIERRLSCS